MIDDKDAKALGGIRVLLLWVPFFALVLHVIGMALVVPRGYGIEDYLGWTHEAAVAAMNAIWHRYALGPVCLMVGASAYLVLDTAVFMPLYGAFFVALADKLLCATARDGRRHVAWLRPLVIGMVVALLLADGVENLMGMARLGGAFGAGSLVATAAALAVLIRVLRRRCKKWLEAVPDFLKRQDRPRTAKMAAIVLAVLLGVAVGCLKSDGRLDGGAAVLVVGALAHVVKQLALAGCALLLGALAAGWFFGLWIEPTALHTLEERAYLRRAVGDMLGRCRYVWLALVVFAGLALVLNQGRDVLYSVAAMEIGPEHGVSLTGGFVVFAVSAVGMWSFGFAAWLWSRSVCLIQSPQANPHRSAAKMSYADRFARDLARFLGLLPPTLFVLLCASTLHDALMAGQSGVAARMLVFIVLAVVGGAYFAYAHASDSDEPAFYDCDSYQEWGARVGDDVHPRFRLFGVIKPFALPFFAAGAVFACRLAAVAIEAAGLGPWPPMVLASFLFTLTFWLSIFGWLSLSEQGTATPWVLLLLIVVGLVGVFDLNQNHRIGEFIAQRAPASDFVPTLVAALLAVICLVLFRSIVKHAETDDPSFWGGSWRVGAAMGAALAVLWASDQWAPKPVGDNAPEPLARVSLDDALTGWLNELHTRRDELLQRAGGARLPVYFVDAEGGGIRNAYWTALVLDRLASNVPDFHTRSFSYSGVSGGSVGLAVDRACEGESGPDGRPCLESLGNADLITPLISTWLFEDVLAQILPTSWCRTPACGVLSRGLRFENAMQAALDSLKNGLVASHPAAGQPHRPYLFLNSTWVESGERAIASKVRIDWRDFPAARDQLTLLQHDLSLATASHNSARFPFINAIGALEVPEARCVPEPPPAPTQSGRAKVCGHLADGGYFDNSGGHTTANILDGLARCLSAAPRSACPNLSDEVRTWARGALAPQVIQIRNGIQAGEDERIDCKKPGPPRYADDVRLPPFSREADRYQPGRPGCSGEMKLYGEVLGPLVTAINTTGIGANGKLAEAALALRVQTLFGVQADAPAVANIDLVEDHTFLYPLGWHLSPSARMGMQKQVCENNLLARVRGAQPGGPCRWNEMAAPDGVGQ